jgi:hypothetical protein
MVELLFGRAGAWLAGALVVVAAAGTGYLKGKLDEQDRQKLAMSDVIVKRVEKIRTVYINDGKVSEAYEWGRKEREDEFNKLLAELQANPVLIAMPTSCDLPDDVVRLLNGPRSGASSGAGKPAHSMRWATSLEGR